MEANSSLSSTGAQIGLGTMHNAGNNDAMAQETAVRPRTIILCFDGTGNKFGTNSNVVRFFQALKKDQSETQIVYYQAGIGTYLKKQFWTRTVSLFASKLDEAIALSLNDHVKEGYTFLINTYKPGDKICLFGFSRGAYTARALAGMVYKVGLLQPHNDQQVDFAFTIYKDDAGLGGKFKRAFATPAKIDFLGVWDTVSSVGIIPRTLPYSSQNDGVKVFRHALALDECRARFRPNIWGEPATVREELDDEPDIPPRTVPVDEWVYHPPDVPDVKEVWFAGCHADVGGGSHEVDIDVSLSNITLRWMIRECFLKTNIRFDEDLLHDLGLDIQKLKSNAQDVKIYDISGTDPILSLSPRPAASIAKIFVQSFFYLGQLVWLILGCIPPFGKYLSPPAQTPAMNSATDVFAEIYNQLLEHKVWWILEFIPMLSTLQKEDGSWSRFRRRNYGRGRYLPYSGNEVKVHRSVQSRIEKLEGYEPAVYNWVKVNELNMIKWED